MSALVTRSELAARIRVAADQPNTGGKFPNVVLFPMIKEAVNALYDLLIAGHGADYYSESVYLRTTAGQATVDLPPNFYQLESILINPASPSYVLVPSDDIPTFILDGEALTTGWRELPRLTKGELAGRRNRSGTNVADFVYATTGVQDGGAAQLRLYPTPRAQFGIQVLYIPTCQQTEVGIDLPDVTYDGINGWESFVVAYVCELMAVVVEDSTISYWQGKKAEVAARIAALATQRDQAQPERVADRTGDCDDDRYGGGYGRRGYDDDWV